MKFGSRWLTHANLLMFWITISQGQQICNDTQFWKDPNNRLCYDYEFDVSTYFGCPNGAYTLITMRYGGDAYTYPEFNCCTCGKGWPLWFVPAVGYTAEKAIPEITMNLTHNLMCNDTYRNATACTMKCKALPDDLTITSLATVSAEDFNQSNCTLDVNTDNNPSQYILQIPSGNYLIYFTNWTTNQYNFSCINSTGMITSQMLCRYEVDEQPFESLQCPSNNITSRYIPPDCVDTENWRSSYGFSCFEYEVTELWCANGNFTPGSIWTGGPLYLYPERNCCACGKGSLSPTQSTSIFPTNNSINSSEIGIMLLKNCSAAVNPNYIFDIKCLGALNFINTNIAMNATLYNCPLDCFFDWNTTQIITTQSINVSRQLYGPLLVYYLTSNLFTVQPVVCKSLLDEAQISTDSSSIPTTSEQITDSSSMATTSEDVTDSSLVCSDTYSWSNSYGHPCSDYEFNQIDYWWCPNGTYTWNTMWTGGNTFKYPEFNCCGCGKGWPLWFVPAVGYTAEKAIPEITMNLTHNLMCNDTYRNTTACTMKCKALPDDLTVTSLATMSAEDFNQSNCTLDLNMKNNSFQYIFQIPVDNYLIYFTNWTTNQYNFSCVNSTVAMTPHMLCRYEDDEQPFESLQCPSNNIISRYIPPDCVDTENWRSSYGLSCFEYEVTQLWCADGSFTPGSSWTGGAYYNYPERNCCACGKGSLSPTQSTSIFPTNNSINSSEIGIMVLKNCNAPVNPNYSFDIKCLGELSFINTNITMDVTFFNCPLDCFFDWNTTQIKNTQSINVSRQLYGPLLGYYLTSNLFSVEPVVCGSLTAEEQTSTDFSSISTTSEQVTDSSSMATISDKATDSSSIATTSEQLTDSSSMATTSEQVTDSSSMATTSAQLTDSSSMATTSEQVTDSSPIAITFESAPISSSTIITDSPSSSEFRITPDQPVAWQPIKCANGKIGLNCNISADTCLMAKPCLNNGTCLNTNSSFICLCPPSKFTGSFCEIDIRPCKPYTCLYRGICNEPSPTSFVCQCDPGYEGLNCESLINYCHDVKCQNNGQCRPTPLNFTCECTSKDFSGRYCEMKSSSLITKQTVNRSFGYIAIIALVIVAGFIVSMDVLKYGFNIDPVDKERKRLQEKKRQQSLKKHRPVAIRYIYVAEPKLDTILEES